MIAPVPRARRVGHVYPHNGGGEDDVPAREAREDHFCRRCNGVGGRPDRLAEQQQHATHRTAWRSRTRPSARSSCGPKPGVKATGTPINIGTIDTHQPGHRLHRRPEHDQRLLRVRERERRCQRSPAEAVRRARSDAAGADHRRRQAADPDRSRRRDRRRLRPARVHARRVLLEVSSASSRWTPASRRSAGRRRTARPSTWGRATERRRRAVRDQHGQGQEDRVRPVERPGHRLHRRRPEVDRRGLAHPDHGADRERADQRRRTRSR